MLSITCASTGEPIDTAAASSPARFDILDYRIRGNTLLDVKIVEGVVMPYLGAGKSIDDIEKARQSLEQTYKDSGFPAVVVNIPEQTVSQGIVYLDVVEGKISRVLVTGSKYHSISKIKDKFPALSRDSILYLPDVQKQIDEYNQNARGSNITPVLRPGRIPGTIEVELKVQDELPLSGKLELNNRSSQGTSDLRAIGTIRYDNLFQRQHSISLFYQTSPEKTKEVDVWALTYMLPTDFTNDQVVFYGIKTSSAVSVVDGLNVLGDGYILGGRYVMPLGKSTDYSHSVSFGVDYKNFNDKQEVGADIAEFPASYLPFAVRYDGSIVAASNLWQFNAGLNLGLPIIAKQEEFTAKRDGTKTNYFNFVGGLSYRHIFNNKSEFRFRADTQLATSPLISNEQFSVGGAESVRGYYESQVIADSGITTSLEWVTPPLLRSYSKVNEFRGLLFVDMGVGENISVLPGEEARNTLASVGLGLRLRMYKNLAADIDAGWARKSAGEINKGDVRIHGRLAWEF